MRSTRKLEIVVISDVHLGTYGCHAEELLEYLGSIETKILILNGDVVDIWQFSKRYWPRSHMKVLQAILKMASQGVEVYYLTGNHDEVLRKFTPLAMGCLTLQDKLVLNVDGKKLWFFHGDLLDSVILKAKWLARLGSVGYDILILLNRMINKFLLRIGRPRVSLSKKIKDGVKRAAKHVSDFEKTIASLAVKNGYDVVICGHIHKAENKKIVFEGHTVQYLNSGDWVESLTSLEYKDGSWSLFSFEENHFRDRPPPIFSRNLESVQLERRQSFTTVSKINSANFYSQFFR